MEPRELYERRLSALTALKTELSRAQWDGVVCAFVKHLQSNGWTDFSSMELLDQETDLRRVHEALEKSLPAESPEQWEHILVCQAATLFVQIKRMK